MHFYDKPDTLLVMAQNLRTRIKYVRWASIVLFIIGIAGLLTMLVLMYRCGGPSLDFKGAGGVCSEARRATVHVINELFRFLAAAGVVGIIVTTLVSWLLMSAARKLERFTKQNDRR